LDGVELIHADTLRRELGTIHELTAMSYSDRHRRVCQVLFTNDLGGNKLVWDCVIENLESTRSPPTSEYEEELDKEV
jgi:hypothetical protein